MTLRSARGSLDGVRLLINVVAILIVLVADTLATSMTGAVVGILAD